MSGLDGIITDRTPPATLAHTTRKPKGYFTITGPMGMEDEGETLMCVHCQMHWQVKPGSGTKRGYCMRCNGPTCGRRPCEKRCVPFERALEQIETKGRLDREMQRVKTL
jgi:hypothetical protein